MLAASAGLGVLMGVPRTPPTPQEVEEQRAAHLEHLARGELLGALEDYRLDHGDWPPGGAGDGLESALAPYVHPLPENPSNGRSDVRFLRPGDRMPAPDGTSGWVFDPETGELRSNAAGERRGDA